MSDSTITTALETGGGNIHYIFHVSGYPWACTTSQHLIDILDDGSHDTERRKIFGHANIQGTYYWADDTDLCQFVPSLQIPGKQSVKLHYGKAELSGGNFTVEILDDENGKAWSYAGASFRGLDGLHRIAQPSNDSNIAWGFLNGNFIDDDDELNITEQSGSILYSRIDAASAFPYKLLWIGQECIAVDGVAIDEYTTHDLTIDVAGASYGTLGRGLFRSREQNHWGSSFSKVTPMVCDVPLSISDKPCWLWAVLMNDDNTEILDGPSIMRWGKVGKNITTKDGLTKISVLPPWSQLDTSISLSKLDARLGRYTFGRLSTSGTTSASVLENKQGPHLVIREFSDADDTEGTCRNIWICDSSDSWIVTFDNFFDVIMALHEELEEVSRGSTSQKSGAGTEDSPYITTTFKYYTRNLKIVQEEKSGGTTMTKPSRITGPLAWLFSLGAVDDGDMDFVSRQLAYPGSQWFYYATSTVSDYSVGSPQMYCMQEGVDAIEGRFLTPGYAWIARYHVDFGWNLNDISGWNQYHVCKPVETFLVAGSKLYLQADTEYGDIPSSGELYLGSAESEGDRPRFCKFTVASKGTEGDYPYITTSQLYAMDGFTTPFFFGSGLFNIPALHASSSEINSNFGVGGILSKDQDKLGRLSDGWLVTNQGSSSSPTMSGVFRALLGDGSGAVATIPENYVQRQIVGFTTIDRGTDENDFVSMIDWDSLDANATKILDNQIYVIDLSDTINLYRMLVGEMQFHGIHPTYEWDQEYGQFMIRFRKVGAVNVTKAFSEGRTIGENDIIHKSPHETSHSHTWLYNKIEASFNYGAGEAKANLAIDYWSGAMVGSSEEKTLKITALLSSIEGLQELSPDQASKVVSYFSDNLRYFANPNPVISINTLLTAPMKCGVGKDILVTDRTMRSTSSYEPGITDAPALMTAMSVDFKNAKASATVTLSEDFVYGWAPAALITSGTKPHASLGVNYILATVDDPHVFSATDDRKDHMWFDCYEWSKTTNVYTAKDCSCSNYKVFLYEKGTADDPLEFDVISVDESTNTLVLYGSGDYASYGTSTEYVMTFVSYDDCESCQQKFVFFADDNNKVGTANDQASRWE